MAFKPISTQEGDSNLEKDLPWANEWAKTVSNPEEPRLVYCVRQYDTGLMVVTHQYKAYVHKGTEQYDDLLEALQVWLESKAYGVPLLCSINKRRKPVLGTDEDKPESRWIRSEANYVQVCNEPIAETLKKERVNPLLAGRGVPGTTPVSEGVGSTSPASDVPAEPSGRARKAR